MKYHPNDVSDLTSSKRKAAGAIVLTSRDLSIIRRGYLYAFIAAITGGTFPVASKYLEGTTAPVAISGYVFLLSGLMLIPYKPGVRLGRSSAPLVLVVGLLGAATAPVLYQFGLQRTTAVNASLLSNGEVFFTSVIAFAIFGERLERKQLLEGLVVAAGLIVVATNLDVSGVQFLQGFVGNLLVLAATFFWSVENNILRIASSRFGAALVTKYRNLFGGGLVLLLAALLSVSLKLTEVSTAVLLFASLMMAITSLFSITALGTIGAVRTLLVFSTSSIFGALFSLVFLGEGISTIQVAGGAAILAGVYMIQRSESGKRTLNP